MHPWNQTEVLLGRRVHRGPTTGAGRVGAWDGSCGAATARQGDAGRRTGSHGGPAEGRGLRGGGRGARTGGDRQGDSGRRTGAAGDRQRGEGHGQWAAGDRGTSAGVEGCVLGPVLPPWGLSLSSTTRAFGPWWEVAGLRGSAGPHPCHADAPGCRCAMVGPESALGRYTDEKTINCGRLVAGNFLFCFYFFFSVHSMYSSLIWVTFEMMENKHFY